VNSQFLTGPMAWRVFACFGAAYFMSYALRSVNAVIAPELVAEFALSNAQLGALSSAYFFSFALLQLPLGVSLDHFGSRRTDASLLIIAAAGCASFAMAQGFFGLWIGRALIGAGVAGALMAALKGYRFWYPAERQQQLAAWMLVVGTGGALAVTVPVQLAVQAFGWRGVFWLACVLMLLAATAIWTLVPRDEEQQVHAVATGSIWNGYREVFSDRYFWRFAPAAMVIQGCFISMQTLWAGPWFTRVLGLGPVDTAGALFVFNLVLLFSYIGLGSFLPALGRRGWSTLRIVGLSTVLTLCMQAAIALVDGNWGWWLWLPFAVFSSGYIVLQPHVCTTFPAALTGRAYTAFNLMIFSGIFICQWLFGVTIDLYRSFGFDEIIAFRHTLLTWVVIQALPFALMILWRVAPRASQPAG
jgi:MFS family permease